MVSSIVLLGIFVAILVVKSAIHRYLRRRGVVTIKTAAIHLVGFGILLVLWRRQGLSFPLSTLLVYGLAAILETELYAGVVLGGETPAAMILTSFKSTKEQSLARLVTLFTTEGLIWKRVKDLQRVGLVREKGNAYAVTGNGRFVASAINWYQKIFRRRFVG